MLTKTHSRRWRWVMSSLMFVLIMFGLAGRSQAASATDTLNIDDTDARFVYSPGNANNGGWDSWSDGTDSIFASEHWSNSAGAKLTIKFNGNRFELYGKRDPSHAIMSLSIDGAQPIEIDEYAPAKALNQKLYATDQLSAGAHEAVLTVLAKRNPDSTGTGSVYGVQVSYAAVDATANNSSTGGNGNGGQTPPPPVDSQELTASISDGLKMIRQADYGTALTQSNARDFNASTRQGSTVNAQITLTTPASAGLQGVTLSASELKSTAGAIAAKQVQLFWVDNVKANIGRGNPGAPTEAFPDVMRPATVKDIPAKTVQSAWVQVAVPADTPAGHYTGTVTAKTADGQSFDFKLAIDVVGVKQVSTEDAKTQFQLWQHPFSTAVYRDLSRDDWFTPKHFDMMRKEMSDYAKLGGHDAVVNIVEEPWNHQSYSPDPSMIQWTFNPTAGTITFDYSALDKWIDFLIETKVLDPANGVGAIKSYSIVPWNNIVTMYDSDAQQWYQYKLEPGSDSWTFVWTAFLQDYMKHMKEKGWFDMTYISMDERGLDQLRPAVDLISSVTDEDGKSFKISSALNYQSPKNYDFTDKIFDMSVDLEHIAFDATDFRNLTAHRSELGLTTTVYTATGDYPNNNMLNDPAGNAWTMWYTLSVGADGFMRWALDNWVNDPLNDANYKYWEPGDGWFIYPTEKGAANTNDYYSTPRYEALKSALEDVNLARYLLANGDEATKTAVRDLVTSLKRPNKKTDRYGSAVATTPEDRELVISEVRRMHEGLAKIVKGLEPPVPVVDKAKLQQVIKDAEAKASDKYTVESFGKLSTALTEAKKVAMDPNATQVQVDSQATLLQQAINGLVEIENKPGEKPDENKPGENKPGENKPGENTPGENKPGENKPGQNNPQNGQNSTLPNSGAVTPQNQAQNSDNNRLPQTGEQTEYVLALIGLATLVIMSGFAYKERHQD